MPASEEEHEPEVLTYRAYCERQTRLAWEARRRAHQQALEEGLEPKFRFHESRPEALPHRHP